MACAWRPCTSSAPPPLPRALPLCHASAPSTERVGYPIPRSPLHSPSLSLCCCVRPRPPWPSPPKLQGQPSLGHRKPSCGLLVVRTLSLVLHAVASHRPPTPTSSSAVAAGAAPLRAAHARGQAIVGHLRQVRVHTRVREDTLVLTQSSPATASPSPAATGRFPGDPLLQIRVRDLVQQFEEEQGPFCRTCDSCE